MTDLEKAKTRLLSQLVLLDSICNEFIANSRLHVVTVRLEQWRMKTNETLLRFGKGQTLDDTLKMITENIFLAPADRILEYRKRYRAFVIEAMKEGQLNQTNDESQSFLPCTD